MRRLCTLAGTLLTYAAETVFAVGTIINAAAWRLMERGAQ